MSARRPTPPGGTTASAALAKPDLPRERESGETPTVSGEYRMRAPTEPMPRGGPYRSPQSPRRYATVTMAKVEAPPEAQVDTVLGRLLDEEITFERARESAAPLDLADFDPISRRASVPRMPAAIVPQIASSPYLDPPPPSSRSTAALRAAAVPSQNPARTTSRELLLPPAPPWRLSEPPIQRATSSEFGIDSRAAVAAFAGYGDPPATIWETPGYAVRVYFRRRRLGEDLASARRRRSPDVALYEAALRAADFGAVRRGIGLTIFFVLLGIVATLALIEFVDASGSPALWQ